MGWRDRIQQEYQRLRQRKAVSDYHPELVNRVHVYSSSNGEQGADIDSYYDYATVYEIYTWVRTAINTLAENYATQPVQVVDAKGVVIPSHPLQQMFDAPNDQMSPDEFWRAQFLGWAIGGESLIELVPGSRGMPAEMWPRRPDRVLIEPDRTRMDYPKARAYWYQGEPDGGTPLLEIPYEYGIWDVLRSPLSEWRGISLLRAAAEAVTIDLYSQAYSKGFLRNNARPDYAITNTIGLTPDEHKRVEQQILDKYTGNNHRPMVLENGQMIHVLSFPQKDIEFLAQREVSRQEVGAIFKVPDEIMGFGKDTYENLKTAMEMLWTLGIKPWTRRRDMRLTFHFSRVLPMLRPGEKVKTDLSGVDVLQQDKTPVIEQAKQLWAMGIPWNVLDESLGLGIGPIPGGDIGYIAAGLQPIGLASDPAATAQNEALRGVRAQLDVMVVGANAGLTPEASAALVGLTLPDGAIAPPPPTPQLAQEQGAEPVSEEAAKVAKAIRQAVRKASARTNAQTLRTIRTSLVPETEEALGAYFSDLADLAVARLGFEVKLIQPAVTKADGDPLPEGIDAAMLITPEDADGLQALINQFYIKLLDASWDTWNTELQVSIDFDVDDPVVRDVLGSSAERVVGINDVTREAVQTLLQTAYANGWTIDDLVKGRDGVAGLRAIVAQTYQGRARTIARTELGMAQQAGAVARYEAAGVEKVLVMDNGVDDSHPTCRELADTIQTLAWARANPLQHPNCLRAFGAYFDD